MERWMKYAGIGAGLFLLLMVATVIIIPLVINVQRYLPEIEEKLSDITGRPVTIGSDLSLSFFPSPGISFSNFQIDNPEGYLSEGFVRIASFEVRFAMLPLLKREMAISRFIISGLEVNLEKRADGKVNWDFSQRQSRKGSTADPVTAVTGWFLPQGVTIDLLVVTDGVINWLDNAQSARHRFADLMLIGHDFNLKGPVAVEFKASIAGKTLAAQGTVGPLGHRPGNGPWPGNLARRFIDTFSGQITGRLIEQQEGTASDFVLQAPPFSAKDLVNYFVAEVAAPVTNVPVQIDSVGFDIDETGDKEKVGTGQVRINPLQIKENRD
jgi:AsmA protein